MNNNNQPTRRRFLQCAALATSGVSLLDLHSNGAISTLREVSTTHYICTTCGTQFGAAAKPPPQCPICIDERQYVALQGQQWTTLEEMRRGQWHNEIREQEPDLFGIGTEPKFGIGQRALLVRTPEGNVLWDCISLLDDQTIAAVKNLGGISAIAISHPHYYSSMVEWSRAFNDAPIHLHESDQRWVQRPDKNIQFWSGETKKLTGGLTLIRTGGHFEGFQVLHWSRGANGDGVLLAGDQPQVAADRAWVSFMYSYPNFIPLNGSAVRRIMMALRPFRFERLYGFSWTSIVQHDATAAVTRSADRYLKAISG